MAGFFKGILNLLFPPRCTFCRRITASNDSVCRECRRTLPWRDGGNDVGDSIDAVVAPLIYRGDVQKAIHRFKFNGRMEYAGTFGELIAAEVRRTNRSGFDLVTWVPVSDKRRRQRGYDQSMLLASAVALSLDGVAAATLEKIRDNPAQSGLKGVKQRKTNVTGAYRAVDAEIVGGKRVLLVDDVYTTGATMEECALVLRAAGAASVIGATLAKTEQQ